jgi:hypothetical protein
VIDDGLSGRKPVSGQGQDGHVQLVDAHGVLIEAGRLCEQEPRVPVGLPAGIGGRHAPGEMVGRLDLGGIGQHELSLQAVGAQAAVDTQDGPVEGGQLRIDPLRDTCDERIVALPSGQALDVHQGRGSREGMQGAIRLRLREIAELNGDAL